MLFIIDVDSEEFALCVLEKLKQKRIFLIQMFTCNFKSVTLKLCHSLLHVGSFLQNSQNSPISEI